MIIELMMLLIAVGVGIVFIAWSNTRKRKQDAMERREVEQSTGKLKQELERTATEIIGRMENHVTHLEKVLDESERNRTQLEGRVTEMKMLLKKGETQAGEIRDLLARLDDAGSEMNAIQRKMDVVERKLNLAMTTPIQIQQPVAIPQMTPLITQPAPIASISPPTPKPQPVPQPAPIAPMSAPKPQPAPAPKPQPVATVTTPPPEHMNPLGAITMPQIRSNSSEPKIEPPKPEVETNKEFDKILEEAIAEPPKIEEPARPQPRSSVVLSSANKPPIKIVEADPVKIEATRKRLTEASAKMAENPPEEVSSVQSQAQALRRKRTKTRLGRDVRQAALDAIREAETQSTVEVKSAEEPKEIVLPEKPKAPERRELRLETTDSSLIKEMLLSGMTIEEIARETGLGRGAIELVQELTRRQLNRR